MISTSSIFEAVEDGDDTWRLTYEDGATSHNILSGTIYQADGEMRLDGSPVADGAVIEFPAS